MDKYTIEKDLDFTIIRINHNDGSVFAVLVDKDGDLIEYEKAELVCRLLNENDGRKNQPRIDKRIKEGLVTNFYGIINYMYGDRYNFEKNDKKVKTAIEILSNLPTGEN